MIDRSEFNVEVAETLNRLMKLQGENKLFPTNQVECNGSYYRGLENDVSCK